MLTFARRVWDAARTGAKHVKAVRSKLTIGAGRPSGLWLMLLLLLAALLPSVCLLWFMNQAVHNLSLIHI